MGSRELFAREQGKAKSSKSAFAIAHTDKQAYIATAKSEYEKLQWLNMINACIDHEKQSGVSLRQLTASNAQKGPTKTTTSPSSTDDGDNNDEVLKTDEKEDSDDGSDGERASATKRSELIATFAWTDDEVENGLVLHEGDIISVLEMDDEEGDGWWLGECDGKTGYFPVSYTAPITRFAQEEKDRL